MADEDIREGSPKKAKKKAPPPDEEEDDRPRKKKRDDDEEEEEAPRKKKKKRMDEDEQEEGDLGSSPLSAIIPVGGSIFGLLSLWLGVLSVAMGIAGMSLFWKEILMVVLPGLWPIALLCGILAFFTHKHKASYGSIAGNIRAIIGILLSLGVMVMHAVLVFIYLNKG